MAALSVTSETRPRWIKQGAHWVKNYPSSSSIRTASARSSMEAKTAPLDTEVLLNILRALQKLDCKMEVQGRRLEILETSPISNTGSTLVNSPISRKQSTRTATSKRTLVHSEDNEDTNDYAHAILKMDYAIDEAVSFINEGETTAETTSGSEVSDGESEKIHTVTGTWADLVPEPRDVDLYSVSMYTGDLLGSRMSLDVSQIQTTSTPPVQRLPSRPHSRLSVGDLEDDQQSMDIEECPKTYDEHRGTTSFIGNNYETATGRAGSVVINTKETKTSPTYLKIELVFHALDNWKQGLISKVKNESKTIWAEEKQRFSELRHTYRAKDMIQQIVDKLGSTLENEWKEEKERTRPLRPGKKRGVKVMGWRIVISFRSLFNVSRERSKEDAIC